MRKTFIALTAAILMAAPAYLPAEENIGPNDTAAGKQIAASEPAPEVLSRGAAGGDEKKGEEAMKAEEERKAAEEAKKVIAARVNGEAINMFMLARAMNRVAPKYVKQGENATPEITAKIKSEALDRLIFEELAVQEATKQGINPEPGEIEKVVARVKENLGSEQAYREYLDKNNLTEDVLKKLIERSRLLELITAKEVYNKVKVEEKLLRDEYEKEKGKYILPDNFVVADVWFVKGKDEAARKHADEILETLRKKDNDTRKLVLDGTFIVRNITVKKEKYPEIYKAVTAMKVGDMSGLIDEKDGFHIIKVSKKEPSRQATFEEARPTLEPKFLYPAQEQRRRQWQKELKEKAKIEILLADIEKGMKEEAGKQEKEKK